jgi:ASPIC/UnbV protein/VCBS repeat protein
MSPPRIKRLVALLVVLLICLAMFVVQRRHRALLARKATGPAALISPELLAQFTAIEDREQHLDETTWAQERRAEECSAVFEALWDGLNRATNKFDLLASFPVGELVVSKYSAAQTLLHAIQLWQPSEPHAVWLQGEWQQFLAAAEREGWRLDHIEFRHRSFDSNTNGEPKHSRFSFCADAENPNGVERATIEGDLLVDWFPNVSGPQPVIKHIDASGLTIRSRLGQVPFEPLLTETIQPPEKWLFIDPLILYDLDRDGLSEIILAGKNLVYRRHPDGQYAPEPLCKYSPGRIFSAIIADFDGDGFADLLCAKPDGLFLFKGSPQGTFDEPGRLAWAANPPLKYVQVLTCGDIDQDGDLDVFLGQYKSPYFNGQMPSPYSDANDGDPAYLLLNDGKGNFTDATESSGLAKKRWRRSYSGSFVKLEGTTNLDLIVVSDFAGLDLYRNDGHGHFTDVTQKSVPDPMGFGMAHALADFNVDGRLDLLMIGMESPTVERLEHLGLRRPDAIEDRTARTRLTFGNRLLLARPGGGFEQTTLNDSIAQSGWSWGCSAFDFDNDGFPDVYIANGHETRATVKEYEPEYWLHDIYVAGSTDDRAKDLYFQSKFTRTRMRGQSYGGYEENRLYLNLEGVSFLEAGYLMGVGLEQDCRNVVTDDLDGDGKMDLLVTTFEVWPEPKQTLRVYRNTLPDSGNWIGFRFREEGHRNSPVGTSVTIHYGERSATRQIVTGDSYRSQSANTLHFGLGNGAQVDRADIIWSSGSTTRIDRPAINKYHLVNARDLN